MTSFLRSMPTAEAEALSKRMQLVAVLVTILTPLITVTAAAAVMNEKVAQSSAKASEISSRVERIEERAYRLESTITDRLARIETKIDGLTEK